MLIDEAASGIGGSTAKLDNSIDLGGAEGSPPYRRTWYLDISVPTDAEEISVREAPARLAGSFVPREWTLSGTDLDGLLSNEGNGVRLALPGAWKIVDVGVHADCAASGHELCLHRYDGNLAVASPSLCRSVASGAHADLRSADFVAHRAHLRIRQNGSEIGIDRGKILSLTLLTFPTAARLGFALADESGTLLDRPAFFHTVPGPVEAGPSTFEAGIAAAKALGRLLTRVDPVPGEHRVALVAESSAPCRLTWAPGDTASALTFDLTFKARPRLLAETGGDGAVDKRTLRFAGRERQAHVFELPLPAGIVEASLDVTEHFPAEAAPTATDGETTPQSGRGARLDARSWVAAPLDIDTAQSLRGVAVALLPIARNSRLVWRLERAHNGSPDGAALTEGAVDCPASGRGSWLVLRPTKPLDLQAGHLWLVMQAVQGRAVWLAGSGDGKALRVVRGQRQARWEEDRCWTDLPLWVRPLRRSTEAPGAGYQVRCGNQALAPEALTSSRSRYRLGTAIADWRAVHGATSPVPMEFVSLARGMLSVYAPVVTLEP